MKNKHFFGVGIVALLILSVVFGYSPAHAVPNRAGKTKVCTNTPTLDQKWGGMTYVNWKFNINDINALKLDVRVANDPGVDSHLYLQLYDGNIDGSAQYFGMQTNGQLLFARFGTADPSNASVPEGSTLYADGNPNNGEGATFISLRRQFGSLPTGTYSLRMERTNYDGIGDWFAYYATFPSQKEVYIGSLRFPRSNPNVPASFNDGGGTWTEAWDNNGSSLYPVSLWHVRTAITANGRRPYSAVSSYSSMPNSDIYAKYYSKYNGELVDHVIGGCTKRVHPAGVLWTGLNG